MPQLDPSPWLPILYFSWLIILALVPQKVTNHSFPNELPPQAAHCPKTGSWDWPWS